jgi:hypothetical protein
MVSQSQLSSVMTVAVPPERWTRTSTSWPAESRWTAQPLVAEYYPEELPSALARDPSTNKSISKLRSGTPTYSDPQNR